MAKLIFSTICLAAFCILPGGDSANLSLQRRPLDVRPHSADNPSRVARSVLAARVIDEHGNPVHLRSNGHPGSRRVVNPFVTSHAPVTSHRRVTSHGRQQHTRTSSGNRWNYGRSEIHTRTMSRTPARHSSRSSPFRRSSQISPQNTFSRRSSQISPQNTFSRRSSQISPQNTFSRRSSQISPQNTFSRRSSQISPQNTFSRQTGQSSRQNTFSRQTSRPKPFTTQPSRSSAVIPHNSRSSGVFQQTQQGNTFSQRPSSSSSSSSSSGQAVRQTSSPSESDIGRSVYSHGLEPHTPLNARDMATFLIQRSQRPRHYLDRTKGTGTLHSSHPGQCAVVDQSRCGPLPEGPLPPSCGNDYQCHGQMSKCCYDPCLTFNKCVQPVNG